MVHSAYNIDARYSNKLSELQLNVLQLPQAVVIHDWQKKKGIHGNVPLDAAYGVPERIATTPATDETKITFPFPEALRRGCASCAL